MINVAETTNWLIDKLHVYSNVIVKSYIFGSFARLSENIGDCDLLLVVRICPQEDSWDVFRQYINKIQAKFANKFKIHLSLTILSEEEYNEKGHFINCIEKLPIIPLNINNDLNKFKKTRTRTMKRQLEIG